MFLEGLLGRDAAAGGRFAGDEGDRSPASGLPQQNDLPQQTAEQPPTAGQIAIAARVDPEGQYFMQMVWVT